MKHKTTYFIAKLWLIKINIFRSECSSRTSRTSRSKVWLSVCNTLAPLPVPSVTLESMDFLSSHFSVKKCQLLPVTGKNTINLVVWIWQFGNTKSQRQINTANLDVRNTKHNILSFHSLPKNQSSVAKCEFYFFFIWIKPVLSVPFFPLTYRAFI